MATKKEIEQVMKGYRPQPRQQVTVQQGQEEKQARPVMIRTQPIAIGIPMDEIMYSRCFAGFMQIDWMPWDHQLFTFSTYLPDARNRIHNAFLQSGAPYLMMLDSDIWAPPTVIRDLMRHNLPFVGGWYRQKRRDAALPVVYDFVEEKSESQNYAAGELTYRQRTTEGKGLEPVGAIGAGCMLMRRDVAEALGENPFDMRRGGEDLELCKRITEAGFKVMVDWDVHCAHVGVTYA